MTTNIYILKLENDKWYIGKSDNPEQRFNQHKNNYGSAWTAKYKPIELFKIIENVSPFLEDAYTKEYMSLYGIDNVRGGSYVRIELTKEQKYAIQKELWSMKNLCNNCGSSEHWVSNCLIIQETPIVVEEPIQPIIEHIPYDPTKYYLDKSTNKLLKITYGKNPITEFFSKINNEFTNSNSDLRSGRFFNRLFR